jgi:MFS superfamily sulfate permease-like transporter
VIGSRLFCDDEKVFAAIIMIACVPLMKFGEIVRLWHVDKRDCFTLILTIFVTLILVYLDSLFDDD